jgi:hypothetical protein
MHQELVTLQYWSQKMKMCNDLEGKDSVLLDYNGMSLGIQFQPSAGTVFLQNISNLLPTDTALWLRRTKSSTTPT